MLRFRTLFLTLFISVFGFAGQVYAFDAQQIFQQSCNACHNIGQGPKVGPDLKGVTERRKEDWLLNFIKSPQKAINAGDPVAKELVDTFKIVMPDQAYSDDEIKALLAYIKDVGEGKVAAATEAKPVPQPHGLNPPLSHFYFYVLAILVVTLLGVGLLLDRLYDKKPYLKIFEAKKLIGLGLALVVIIIGGGKLVRGAMQLGYGQNYQPTQPIAFSHQIHAGINKVDCLYCHYAAEKSRHAGIPAVSVCMNCHSHVKKDAPEVQKIEQAMQSNKPLKWVKIHNLPDFVYFNHAQHVVVGKIECQTCHGEVQKMDKVFQWAPLSMGWCIDCHRREQVKVPGPFQGRTVQEAGGLDCNKCHY